MHFREPDIEGKPSRIFLGKNKLLQIALGRSAEEEYSDNLRHVAKLTSGSVGLLFTSRARADVESYFENLAEADFARAGSIASRDVVLENGMFQSHPVSMVEQFRKMGIPVDVQNGRLVLMGGRENFRLCKEGEALSADKCKALVQFGIKLAEFKVELVCRWTSESGEFEKLA